MAVRRKAAAPPTGPPGTTSRCSSAKPAPRRWAAFMPTRIHCGAKNSRNGITRSRWPCCTACPTTTSAYRRGYWLISGRRDGTILPTRKAGTTKGSSIIRVIRRKHFLYCNRITTRSGKIKHHETADRIAFPFAVRPCLGGPKVKCMPLVFRPGGWLGQPDRPGKMVCTPTRRSSDNEDRRRHRQLLTRINHIKKRFAHARRFFICWVMLMPGKNQCGSESSGGKNKLYLLQLALANGQMLGCPRRTVL